jgi:hypothetical protein
MPAFQTQLRDHLLHQDEVYTLMKTWLLEAIKNTSIEYTEAFKK